MVFAERAEDPGRVVFELEIVFRGGGELVPDDVKRKFVSCCKVFVRQLTFNFCLTPRNLIR